jgi:hypothetical protein
MKIKTWSKDGGKDKKVRENFLVEVTFEQRYE